MPDARRRDAVEPDTTASVCNGGVAQRRSFVWTFAALLVLLAATVAASRLRLGVWAPFVAFGIATAKAVLIALYFMHLRHRGGITRLFAVGGLVWLALLFTLTLADYTTRGHQGIAGRTWSERGGMPAGLPAPVPERRPAHIGERSSEKGRR